MALVSVPNTFVPNTVIQSAQVNANFNAIANVINGNLDNTNVGSLGFYASQIIPLNAAEATFGGSQAYSFANGLIVTGGITAGNITASGAVTASSISVTNNVFVNNNLRVGNNISVGGIAQFAGEITTLAGISVGGSVEAVSGFLAGSSSYLPASAAVQGPAQVIKSGGSTLATVPPMLTPSGSDYGIGSHIVVGTLNMPVANAANTASVSVALTGDAIFVNPPIVTMSTISTRAGVTLITGWTNGPNFETSVLQTGNPTVIGFIANSNSGGGASGAQNISINWMGVGV